MSECVVCGVKPNNNGTYGGQFPLCLDCYKSGKFKTFLQNLIEKEKEYYFDCPRIYYNWDKLIKAKNELGELENEAM